MKSIIICEGEIDLVLLQYYMIKINSWNYSLNLKIKYSKNRDLIKNTDKLTIVSCSWCGNIKTVFELVIIKVKKYQNDLFILSKIIYRFILISINK